MDIAELDKGIMKQYFCVYVDVASRLVACGKLTEEVAKKKVYVPKTRDLIDNMSEVWLQSKPRPQWLVVDPYSCVTCAPVTC